ncbi:hypothetical protein AC249_AIPGENE3473 [Exaiptasia diaphana]|nr:hypothetical protein AC249_AIPGENE3473 [Exaiptasia diaphana]
MVFLRPIMDVVCSELEGTKLGRWYDFGDGGVISEFPHGETFRIVPIAISFDWVFASSTCQHGVSAKSSFHGLINKLQANGRFLFRFRLQVIGRKALE